VYFCLTINWDAEVEPDEETVKAFAAGGCRATHDGERGSLDIGKLKIEASFKGVGKSDGVAIWEILMYLIAICVVGFFGLIFGLFRMKQLRERRDLEEFSIEPDALHDLLSAQKVTLYDVRQPLDFLAYAEIIPGATRIAPKDLVEETAHLPRDHDSVIYCTCINDKTSRMILGKARALKFTNVKLLKGGLAAWKAKGYPVERYDKPFRLDTAS
jgi:rhodanese-related sulfurtransferase